MKIITGRLCIRTFEESDLVEFEKLLNIPEVPGWQMQKENSAGFLRWHISNYEAMDIIHGIVCFGIFDKEKSNVLGAVGAGEHDDLHETEIFYNLLPEARGNGYATEAAKAITAWAFANFEIPYIIGTASVGNIPSQKVLENCGYKFVDVRKLRVHIAKKNDIYKYYRYYP
jgi:RimJ/RimL family protein N-acetyltransferase